MSSEVTLTVPAYIIQQAEQIALAEQRQVIDVLREALLQSFPMVYVSPDRPQMLREEEAFRRLHAELMHAYAGGYVAIHQGEVVDHDANRVALVTRLEISHPDAVVLVKHVSAEPERVLHIRLPRWADQ